MAQQDLLRLLDKIIPQAGGEDVVRWRTGKVETVNANGTLDVAVSGLVVPNLHALRGLDVAVGEVVHLAVYRGMMIVLGPVASAQQQLGVARGIMANPTSSTSDGTATAADTVEVRDAVLGDYTFTAEAGRRYRVHYVGNCNSAATDSRFVHRIRDGGASTPTAASTLITEATAHIAEGGTGGRHTMVIARPFTVAAGVHTLGLFTLSPDSAVLTPIAPTGGRELYVEDIGPVF